MRIGFIFDLDGTLADTMPAHYAAWRSIVPRYGLTFTEERFYALAGVPTILVAEQLVAEAGIDVDPTAMAHEKEAAYAEALADPAAIRPIPPVIEIARRHRGEGVLAIASSSPRDIVGRTLRALGILDWFLAIVAAEDTKRFKPEPDCFLEAARRIGLPASSCTVYEDTDIGLEAARRAGMKSVDVRELIKLSSPPTAQPVSE